MAPQDPWNRPNQQQPQYQGQQPPQYPYQQQQFPPPYPPPGQPYPGGQQPSPGRRPPRQGMSGGRKALIAVGAVLGFLVVIGIIGAAAGGGKAAGPAAASSAPAAATAAATHAAATPAARRAAAAPTVTYVVTGTPGADVTYGPAGTSLSGHVPMRVTKKLGSAAYYSIDAQLQGGGEVTVKILVNGKAVSAARASGGYNIATAEIVQNPLTGKWESALSS